MTGSAQAIGPAAGVLEWSLVASAILLWPDSSPRSGAHRRPQAVPVVATSHDPAGGGASQASTPVDRRLLGVIATTALCAAVAGGPGVVAGVVLAPAVWWALSRVGDRQLIRRTAVDPGLALALELMAAALRTGCPVPQALLWGAPAASRQTCAALQRTARLLALGADPADAWAGGDRLRLSPQAALLAPVASVAVRTHASGARLAGELVREAAELRAQRSTAARERAERVGVQALGPLAACFLPSFVCLGIVPVVVGVLGSVRGSLT